MSYRWKALDIFLLFVILSLFAYANSLDNPFLFDDLDLILGDRTVHSWGNIFSWFVPKPGAEVYYRPLAHIIPGVCYLFFQDNPYWYHVVNTILLASASFVVFWVLRYVLTHETIALVASLLFCVHPVNGFLINYITASVFSVQVIFMMFSLYYYVRCLRGHSPGAYAVSLVFWLGALMCHETAMAMPFYFILVSIFERKGQLMRTWMPLLGGFIVLAAYFVFRLQFSSLQTSILNKIIGSQVSVWQFAASFLHLIAYALGNVFLLKDIVFIWTTEVVHYGVVFYCLVFALMIAAFGVALLRSYQKCLVVFLGLGWYAIGFLAVIFACFVKPSYGFIYEPHWMFFANIGIFIFIAKVFQIFWERRKTLSLAVLGVVLIVCVGVGWRYNFLWGDDFRYLNYWGKFAPEYKGIQFWLGDYYLKRGDDKAAWKFFANSVEGARTDWMAYNNLGTIAMNHKEFDQAEKYFWKALRTSRGGYLPTLNLGVVARERGDLEDAKAWMRKAMAKRPSSVEARWSLAKVFEDEGQWKKAEQFFLEAYVLDRTDKQSVRFLIEFYLSHDSGTDCSGYLEQYLKVERNQNALLEIAARLALKGDFVEALRFYEQALDLDLANVRVYSEMGKFFANYNQFDRGVTIWRQGLRFATQDEAEELNGLIKRAGQLKLEIQEFNR